MNAKTAIQELQAYIRKLKKQPASVQIRKAVERAKALIAYYKGIATKTIAQVFNLSERTIKEWIIVKFINNCTFLIPCVKLSGVFVSLVSTSLNADS